MKRVIDIKPFLYWLLFLPFFPLPLIEHYLTWIANINDVWKTLSVSIMLYSIVKSQKKDELVMNSTLLAVLLWWLFLFISTMINLGDIILYIKNAILIVIPFAFIYVLICKGEIDSLRLLEKWLWIIIIINFVTIILYPRGMYKTYSSDMGWHSNAHWFLGHKNVITGIFLFTIVLSSVRSYLKNGKIQIICKLGLLLCVIEAYLMDSQTTGLILLIIFLCIMIKPFGNLIQVVNAKVFVIVELLLFLGLVFLNIHLFFANIITNTMDRSVTLSGRSLIWPLAIKMIIKNPVLGYGIRTERWIAASLRQSWAVHTHCQYLDWLFIGGLPCFILGFFIFWNCAKSVNTITSSQMNILYKAVLIGLMTGMQVEVFMFKTNTIQIWYTICLMSCIDQRFLNILKSVERKDSGIKIVIKKRGLF